jgi:hypothetical protein
MARSEIFEQLKIFKAVIFGNVFRIFSFLADDKNASIAVDRN